MTRVRKKILADVLFTAVAVALVLVVWYAVSAAVDSEFIVPSVGAAFRALAFVFETEQFWTGLGGTLLRCVWGFAAAFVLFIVTFGLSTAFYSFRKIAEPIISALRSLPAVAVTLILIISVGAKIAPVVLSVTVIYPIMYSSAKARAATVSRELKEICRICGASRWATFKALWFPCIAGGLAENAATAFSYNVKAVVGAEILAQTASSLGMLMKLSQINLQPDLLVAYVISAVVVGALCEWILRVLLSVALKKYAV